MPHVLGIDHIAFAARDLEATCAFYDGCSEVVDRAGHCLTGAVAQEPDNPRALCRRPIRMLFRSLGALPPRCRDVSALGDPVMLRLFPMTAVKEATWPEARSINTVETARVHGDFVRL